MLPNAADKKKYLSTSKQNKGRDDNNIHTS